MFVVGNAIIHVSMLCTVDFSNHHFKILLLQIPSSAVEMPPGDAIAVALLDVQFGGLEFGSDSSSLDTSISLETNNTTTVPSATPTPTPSAPTPTSVSASVASIMESYASSVSNSQQQANLANALAQSQKVSKS